MDFGTILNTYILPHWPFAAVALGFSIIGQVMSLRVFVRERAYRDFGKGAKGWLLHSFWYWGRESLPIHPMAAGLLVGCWWTNPEGADPAWSTQSSMGYFFFAGAVSLLAWVWLKARAKKKGITLTLPGASVPPSEPPASEG